MKTPQTDDIARGNHVVPTEWAQQLERERDEAMEKHATEATEHMLAINKICNQRDEAITTIEDAKRALKATDYEGILLAAMRVKEERDEAREALERIYQASMVARSLEEDFAEWEKAIEMLLDLLKKEAQ